MKGGGVRAGEGGGGDFSLYGHCIVGRRRAGQLGHAQGPPHVVTTGAGGGWGRGRRQTGSYSTGRTDVNTTFTFKIPVLPSGILLP